MIVPLFGVFLWLSGGQSCHQDTQQLKQLFDSSKAVVVAKIIQIGPAPQAWSGIVPTVQRIRYQPTAVLKGDVSAREIDVGHYIVKNSRTASSEQPAVSPQLFVQGNRLVLF